MFRDYCWDIFGTWIRHLLNYFEVKSLIFGVLKCWLTLFKLYLQWAVWGGPHQNNISHVHCPPHSLYSQHTCSRLHWWRKVRQHTCLVDAWGVESFPCIYILEKKKIQLNCFRKSQSSWFKSGIPLSRKVQPIRILKVLLLLTF